MTDGRALGIGAPARTLHGGSCVLGCASVSNVVGARSGRVGVFSARRLRVKLRQVNGPRVSSRVSL